MSIKIDQIIENYLGEFSRVVKIKNGMVYHTGWVPKKETAKNAEGYTFQNEKSLKAVLKNSSSKKEVEKTKES